MECRPGRGVAAVVDCRSRLDMVVIVVGWGCRDLGTGVLV